MSKLFVRWTVILVAVYLIVCYLTTVIFRTDIWRQYLTRNEATEIVRGMKPEAPWDYPTWEKAMEAMHLEKERESVFNRYALWVAMNQVYTDFGDSTARMLGEPLNKIPADTIVPYMHDMAVSLLTDKDNVFNIRKYHKL